MHTNSNEMTAGRETMNPDPRMQNRAPPADALKGLRLLIVDDQDDMRYLLLRVLKRYGAEVKEANSVQSALVMLASFDPNVIISDISMPAETGYDFVRKLRKNIEADKSKEEKIPAIALTSHSDPIDKKKALDEGFQVHIAKPVNYQQLVEIVSVLATLDGDAVEHGVDPSQLPPVPLKH
ncbi:MAG TPA: response regulator [Oligoflexus sp.]|uniref:response regulator n=1 Tax=Oligoflexus sp. TaxID=1971216 RepID=UPI002D3D05C0|nr:response regulator [Oligoflexus sp.]HYX31477.1 response regulator [Oligoflexus sp.]